MAIDDVTGDRVRLIDAEGARQLRAAAMMSQDIPFAPMEPIGLEFFVLNPGERAVLPVQWNMGGAAKITECSTHPEAPVGLVVLPGSCDAEEHVSLLVENESELPITVTERDLIAAGVEEGVLPSLDVCASIQAKQESFCRAIDWTGEGKDSEKVVSGMNDGTAIIVVIHHVPLFCRLLT